jgi:hypothetical protein
MSSSWWKSTSGEAASVRSNRQAPNLNQAGELRRCGSAEELKAQTLSQRAGPCTSPMHRRNASTLDATGYWIGVWNPGSANASTFYYGELQFVDGRILPKTASEDPYAHWWGSKAARRCQD